MTPSVLQEKSILSIGSSTTTDPTFLSISEQIAVQLAKDILSGKLAENDKLSEQKLAERFGTSRGPIRDGIKILEQNGFVRSKPRLSARVNSITRHEIQQLFDVRAQILGLLARYAARNATPDDLMALRKNVEHLQQMRLETSGDVGAFFVQSHMCWSLLHKTAKARRISAIGSYVMGSAIWQLAFRDSLLQKTEDYPDDKFLHNWCELLTAIENGDEDKAEESARALVGVTWGMIKDSLTYRVVSSNSGPAP